MSSRRTATVPDKSISLADFMRSKARKGCLICELPLEVRAQLGRSATKKGFTRDDQVEWLKTVCGMPKVTREVLDQHLNGRHDRGDDAE